MNENTQNKNIETHDELDGRFLLFYIDDSLYGLELRYVIEIINIQHITQLPGVPNYVKGIINLRGKVVPVIDVRSKLGMWERSYDDKTCIIVIETHEMQIGIIVDSVSEVVTVETDNMSAFPGVGDSSAKYISSISKIGNRVILNIDCDEFFGDDVNNIMAV